jgi:hypothetical protein
MSLPIVKETWSSTAYTVTLHYKQYAKPQLSVIDYPQEAKVENCKYKISSSVYVVIKDVHHKNRGLKGAKKVLSTCSLNVLHWS